MDKIVRSRPGRIVRSARANLSGRSTLTTGQNCPIAPSSTGQIRPVARPDKIARSRVVFDVNDLSLVGEQVNVRHVPMTTINDDQLSGCDERPRRTAHGAVSVLRWWDTHVLGKGLLTGPGADRALVLRREVLSLDGLAVDYSRPVRQSMRLRLGYVGDLRIAVRPPRPFVRRALGRALAGVGPTIRHAGLP
ncbi:MAG: hypothetical protein SangKO_086930 [Sandaracinaceae bacterium]